MTHDTVMVASSFDITMSVVCTVRLFTGVMAMLRAIQPHAMTDPDVRASAVALASKFLPDGMAAMFLGPAPTTPTTPTPASAAPASSAS